VEGEGTEFERMTRIRGKDVEDRPVVWSIIILATISFHPRHPLKLSLIVH
jgi:hypothetical protein